MTTSNCLNCEALLEPGDKFCFQCGQATHQHRLSLSHLLHEVIHFFTHADKGIFCLLKELIIHPGRVAREYIAGKRKKYFSPLNFFLIVMGLFVFAFTSLRLQQGTTNRVNQASLEKMRNAPKTPENIQRLARTERGIKAGDFMAKYANFVNMFFTPVVALIFYLFFLRSGYNYTEHLVANLYASGINALVFSLIIAPATILLKKYPLSYLILILLFLCWETAYRAIMYYGFIHKRGLKHFLYPLFVSIIVSYAWYMTSTGLIRLYVARGL